MPFPGYAFLRIIIRAGFCDSAISLSGSGAAVFARRYANESFEGAVELRQRLKSDGKRDLADSMVRIAQQTGCPLHPRPDDTLHKIFARDLLEFLAEIIWADIDRLRDFRQGELLVRVCAHKVARFPDFNRLRWIMIF